MSDGQHTPKDLQDQEVFNKANCVICLEPFTATVPVTVAKKGLSSLIHFSEVHGNESLNDYLSDAATTEPVLVHAKCRKRYTDPRRSSMTSENEDVPCQKRLRSSSEVQGQFDWKENCFLCGTSACCDERHPNRDPVQRAETIPFIDNIVEQCDKRNDSWASEVRTRIHGCIDFVAAEARYHRNCYSSFMLSISSVKSVGRPKDEAMLGWFNSLCTCLEGEGDTELYTLDELHEQMCRIAGGCEVYSLKRLKQRLTDHYGDHVFFAEIQGRKNVVCFRNMADYIINEKWYCDRKSDSKQDAYRIIHAAARIIREEMRAATFPKVEYPSAGDIRDIEKEKEYMPHSLNILMAGLMPSNHIRQVSIGQAILQAMRPKTVMAPIMFGLGVEMDHVFGSKWLIDELFQLGFSVSYDEVKLFTQSVVQHEDWHTLIPPTDQTFTQWASDNADHNIRTLTGEGTFHGMGIIAMYSKGEPTSVTKRIERKARVKADELVVGKGVPIKPFIGPQTAALSGLRFEPILTLQYPSLTLPTFFYSNLLWQSAWIFNKAKLPTPNWSGFMQHIFNSQDGEPIRKSDVLILPIIDLSPSDDTCIYSTLLYIEDQASRLNLPSACVTFDQPLWQKAMEIVTAKGMAKVVLRLGGFHLLMSACGSVFHMMKGSGIEEALEQAYGPNAVTQMMSGKAIARALRGLFLIEAALTTKMLKTLLPKDGELNTMPDGNADSESETNEGPPMVQSLSKTNNQPMEMDEGPILLDHSQVEALESLVSDVLNQKISPDTLAESPELVTLSTAMDHVMNTLRMTSRTAKLWLQFLEYIKIIKDFICCERLGMWEGHLNAVTKLLNLFAATGHVHYAKCGRLYVQEMRKLPTTHPWLYQKFVQEGYHTVRRSARLWAGLWTDLVIEQVLMRSLKSRGGGLTRGRGMTESVRQEWVYSMHACASIHDAMTSLTGKKHTTSHQHVEFGTARREHDMRDMSKILDWFHVHDPFDRKLPQLRSLASGLAASDGDGINCVGRR